MNWKPIVVFIAGAILGALLMSQAPLGKALWPQDPTMPDPEGVNLALLMVIGFIEVISFGLGVCVLAFGLPAARRVVGSGGAYAVGLWLSIAWLLVNWVPHTALHMQVGNITAPAQYSGLVAIEYGFHLTLILAGAMLMHALFRLARPTNAASPASNAAARPSRTN